MAISIWDFSLESESRRELGGLPSGEYVLHMILAMVFGGLIFNLAPLLYASLDQPTSLRYQPADVPGALRALMALMAVLVLISGLQDALAVVRLKRKKEGVAEPVAPEWPHEARVEPINCDPARPSPTIAAPAWMSVVLILAGIYNLAWGAWTILFPTALFQLAAMPASNYPQIWQCVGMMVGVYGIGYLLAAMNPRQHWPIVLVGLLGKNFRSYRSYLRCSGGNFAFEIRRHLHHQRFDLVDSFHADTAPFIHPNLIRLAIRGHGVAAMKKGREQN